MNILLVGGAVRNLLLGRAASDKDFLVLDATVDEFRSAYPDARLVGRSFPVFIHDSEEYSFLRRETLADDLLARDFTINAVAMHPDGRFECHPLAREDLDARVLRQASETSFDDDLLRVFRAARFLAEMEELQPADELFGAMGAAWSKGRPQDLSAERVGAELLRALAGERPGRFLAALHEAGCLAPWFAPLDRAASIPAGPPQHHLGSVLEHTVEVMDRLAGLPALTVWMGMVHDLGKCDTSQEQLPRHIGHEEPGERLAVELGERLRLPARFTEAGALASALHMKAGRYAELRPGTRVDLLMRLNSRSLVQELFRMVRADRSADHLGQARADLETILAVRLPPDERNQGERSGRRLRELRARALAQGDDPGPGRKPVTNC